jgi:PPE-repeat protein
MDFWMSPPEVTSALIHSGPGAGSLIAAAGMWQLLGAELEDSVRGCASELSLLTEAWHGASSMTMAAAVEPYLAWLRTTAQQCHQIGSSAQVAVAAFEITHLTVVQPSLVAANRMRLAVLLATNWFGINLPAIAETEAEYNAMWVNNSAAMVHYAVASASAVALPRFSSPPAVANPTALVAQGGVTPAGTTASQVSTISPLATGATAAAQGGPLVNNPWFILANTYANQFIAGGIPINLLSYLAQFNSAQAIQGVGSEIGLGLSEGMGALQAAEVQLASALSAAGTAPAPTAAWGAGVSVGQLMAPPSVVGLLPASELPVQLASAVSPLPSGGSGAPPLPMAPMRMAPPTSAGSRRRGGRDYDNIEYGAELPGTVMPRPPSAG